MFFHSNGVIPSSIKTFWINSSKFRGVNPKSFDGRGNYTVGVKEQLIFPEISFDKIDSIRGMDITIVTSAKSDQEGKALPS